MNRCSFNKHAAPWRGFRLLRCLRRACGLVLLVCCTRPVCSTLCPGKSHPPCSCGKRGWEVNLTSSWAGPVHSDLLYSATSQPLLHPPHPPSLSPPSLLLKAQQQGHTRHVDTRDETPPALHPLPGAPPAPEQRGTPNQGGRARKRAAREGEDTAHRRPHPKGPPTCEQTALQICLLSQAGPPSTPARSWA